MTCSVFSVTPSSLLFYILMSDVFFSCLTQSQNLEQNERSESNLRSKNTNGSNWKNLKNTKSSDLLPDLSSKLVNSFDFTHLFVDNVVTSDSGGYTKNAILTYSQLVPKTRRKRSNSQHSDLDLAYKNCNSDHDSRIKIGLTRGDRFMCWFTNHCACDLEEAKTTYVGASQGVLTFWSPCCLKYCSVNIKIVAPPGKQLVLEFLELHVPSTKSLNSDGSHVCPDSKVFFADSVYQFCGLTAPSPFRIYQNSVQFMLALYRNTQCKDYISFKLKYRMCEPLDMALDICQPRLVTLEIGKSGYVTSPGYSDFTNYPNNLNCSWVITVNEGSFVQLHFEFLNLPSFDDQDTVSFFYADNVYDTLNPIVLVYDSDDLKQIPDYKIILPNNRVTVVFTTDNEDSSKGFKINYEAVDVGQYVPILNQVTLNCSNTDNYIPNHIRCNLRNDCMDGEDEHNCEFFDTEKCAEGHMFGNSCYNFVRPEKAITWEIAEGICQEKYNGHIVTPNTNNELEFLKRLTPTGAGYWYMGLRRVQRNVDILYRELWQGTDGKTYFNSIGQFYTHEVASCSLWSNEKSNIGKLVNRIACSRPWYGEKLAEGAIFPPRKVDIICETKNEVTKPLPILAIKAATWTEKIETVQCIYSKERIQLTRQCDGVKNCNDGSDESNCDYGVVKTRSFQCKSGKTVAYSHVCDGIDDCLDKSDENFCQPIPDGLWNMTNCANGLSIPFLAWCDGKLDCLDHSDENYCETCNGNASLCPAVGCFPSHWVDDDTLDCPIKGKDGFWVMEPDFEPHAAEGLPPPGVVYPDGYGKVLIQPIAASESCPNTHIQCPNGYCIPIYMICNGYEDCPEGEDELPETCSSFCENNYKCQKSTICLHDSHVCDGWFHCPYQDDEQFCNVSTTCPKNCTCSSLEMKCKDFDTDVEVAHVKYLDISSTSLSNHRFSIESYQLIGLNMSRSGMQDLNSFFLPNLYTLDLTENRISFLKPDQFKNCLNVRIFLLARNNMANTDFAFLGYLRHLEILDLSFNVQKTLVSFAFKSCAELKHLRMTNMKIQVIAKNAFSGLSKLETLSLDNNPVSSFQADVFVELSKLSYLTSDNFKFCCSQVVPESLLKGTCDAPANEISSCEDILRTEFFRVFLWVMATLTLLGNSGVLLYYLFPENKATGLGYSTFITSLSGSDLLMGVYLTIIGAGDAFYRGKYLWKSEEWTHSGFCKLAGFLSMVSSEVSALTVCLVTLDRFLALAFPLSTYHFTPRSARITSLITWSLGILIAGIPLLSPLDHWQFYSQNGVCIPLPVTRTAFPGRDYSVSVFIILNFIIFLLIALGQCLVFWAIKSNSMKDKSTREKKKLQDVAIAQKLAFVVITDFLCWFPIGVMGLLARSGIPISGQANVVATIFILPLNSALNPFLYTLAAIKQKIKANREKKRISIKNKIKSAEGSRTKSAKTENQLRKSGSKSFSRVDAPNNPQATVPHARVESNINIDIHQNNKAVSTAMAKTCLKKLELWLKLGKISQKDIQNCVDVFLRDNPGLVQGSQSVHVTD